MLKGKIIQPAQKCSGVHPLMTSRKFTTFLTSLLLCRTKVSVLLKPINTVECRNPNVRNQNFCCLGFQHVLISDVWVLSFIPNLSKIRTSSVWALRPNCLKTELKMSKSQTKWFGFWTYWFGI